MALIGEELADLILEIELWQHFPEAAAVLFMLPDESETTYNPDGAKFDLDSFSDVQCWEHFRFLKDDIVYLADLFQLPEKIILENRCVVKKVDALCMFLARMAYPNRLVQLEAFFNRPKTTVSMTIKEVLNFLFDKFGDKLVNLNQEWIESRRQIYADAIHNKGSPLTNVFAFIDGTVRPICRPVRFQKVTYNGHKRIHALKFQSIVTPDGMIANLYGPMEGRRHDCALLKESGIQEAFENANWLDRDGAPFAIYGDPAYPVRDWVLAPFRNAQNPQEVLFNKCMSSVRECVEWQFGKLLRYFAFLDFRKNLKVFLQPVGKMYIIGAFLTNCHTCLYGSQTSNFFELDPPTIEDYLRLQ